MNLRSTSELTGSIASEFWQLARIRGREGTVRWCPIIEFGEPIKALGPAHTGDWCWKLERESNPEVYLLEGDAAVGVLPLLEIPFSALQSKVHRSSERLGLPPQQVLAALPLLTILRAALATRSDYWVRLAAEWLESSGVASQLRDAIRAAASDVRLEQSLRHRLRRLEKL